MSWLPGFLNPWVAAAAAAVVIPSLLVLYFLKLRRREVAISSTLLWKKAIQDLQVNAPFQKLRRNLLLLLQLLLLLLLLLALARPVLNMTPGAGKLTVILIDRSASMSAADVEGGARLDDAKRRAKELVGTMQRGAYASVVAFDESAETVQKFTSDAVALRDAIDSIRPTDRKTKLTLAYQLADAQMNFNPDQVRVSAATQVPDVMLYSDGRVADAEEASIRAPVTLHKVGSDTAGNIAVVALSAKRNYERPTQVQVFARLANFGPEPAESAVELSVDGEKLDSGAGRSRVYLLPDRWTDEQRLAYERDAKNRPASDSVEFALDLTTAAVIRVEQTNKEGDALKADDVAHVVIPPPKNLSVLLVTDGNYFLEKALRSQTNLQNPQIVTTQAYAQNVPTNHDVIIFDRYKPEKLPPAGSFIYFGAVPDGLKLKIENDEAGLPKVIEDVGVLDWKRNHPILRGLNMGRLNVASALKLDVPLDSEVLLDGLKGPLIARHQEGKHTHLVVAFDVLQSDWPLKQSFPYFMYNALQFLAVGQDMDVRQAFAPGAAPRIPPANLTKGDTRITEVTLEFPSGERRKLKVPETGDFTLPPLEQVGVYKTNPPVPGWEQIAVNLLDPVESNLLPAEKLPATITDIRDPKEGGQSRRELWRYIAGAALVLLFVEWWVYTRRVHL